MAPCIEHNIIHRKAQTDDELNCDSLDWDNHNEPMVINQPPQIVPATIPSSSSITNRPISSLINHSQNNSEITHKVIHTMNQKHLCKIPNNNNIIMDNMLNIK